MSGADYLGDVQGFILRGYRFDVSRHVVVHCGGTPAQAQAFVATLWPEIAVAKPWAVKPPSTLNVGITYDGLLALGVPAGAFDFPYSDSFKSGAVQQAPAIGDTGDSAPANWVPGLGGTEKPPHLILTIFAEDAAALDAATARWTSAFAQYGLEETYRIDAQALNDPELKNNGVHFGYRDSIAQPTIEGAPARKHEVPDDQPKAPLGEFLMGYESQMGWTYTMCPSQLATNGSFGAFRILEQDVAAFETFLNGFGDDKELMAAKVCGRWRKGNPLVLAPSEEPTLPDDELNAFRYGSDANAPDPLGVRCPVGAHIRRSNPRDELVVPGKIPGHQHRIVRRNMPYGPPYHGNGEPDGIPRGLVGYFINVDLGNQFEFLMKAWINQSIFVASVPLPQGNPVLNITGTDVFLGDAPSSFYVTEEPAPPKTTVTNQKVAIPPQRFITTKGSAYCLLPSISALKYLAAGQFSEPTS
jgi:deferrochelatase/peroxidase EfeB